MTEVIWHPTHALVRKPFDGTLFDLVTLGEDGNYRPAYSTRTLERILNEDPSLLVVPFSEYENLYADYLRGKVTQPKEISEEDFLKWLECLPPCRSTTFEGVRLFHCSERIEGSLVHWFAGYRGKHYQFQDYDYTGFAELARKVKECK